MAVDSGPKNNGRAMLIWGALLAALGLVSLVLAVAPFYVYGIDAYYSGQVQGAPGDPKEFAPFSWFGGYVPTALGVLIFGYGPLLAIVLGTGLLTTLFSRWRSTRPAQRGLWIGVAAATLLLFAVTLPARGAITTWLAD